MAETLGSLCDKLTIIKLKAWHSNDTAQLISLQKQSVQMQTEIDEYIEDAMLGKIQPEKLTFSAHKVYPKENNFVPEILGSIGEVFSRLASVNCQLWHTQEHVYEFEKVPIEEKDTVIKQLAVLNLERTRCINQIDDYFKQKIVSITI